MMTKPSREEMSRIGRSNVRRSKSHERRVAHLLTEWAGVDFRRRRVEGRDSTVVERESTADVIPVTGEIIFSIEAKCGECTSFDGLLANPKSNKFTSWWHQCCYDAQILSEVFKRKVYPMLFFKPAPSFDWLAVDQEVFKSNILKPLPNVEKIDAHNWVNSIAFDVYGKTGPIEHNVSHSKKNPVMKALVLPSMYMMRWKDFAAAVDPKSIFVQN
jgi:hypothetical protein